MKEILSEMEKDADAIAVAVIKENRRLRGNIGSGGKEMDEDMRRIKEIDREIYDRVLEIEKVVTQIKSDTIEKKIKKVKSMLTFYFPNFCEIDRAP